MVLYGNSGGSDNLLASYREGSGLIRQHGDNKFGDATTAALLMF